MPEDPLLKVALKAVEDEEFWRDLHENAAAALERARIVLGPEDMELLESLLREDRVPWTLSALMTSLHENLQLPGPRWMGRWREPLISTQPRQPRRRRS